MISVRNLSGVKRSMPKSDFIIGPNYALVAVSRLWIFCRRTSSSEKRNPDYPEPKKVDFLGPFDIIPVLMAKS